MHFSLEEWFCIAKQYYETKLYESKYPKHLAVCGNAVQCTVKKFETEYTLHILKGRRKKIIDKVKHKEI